MITQLKLKNFRQFNTLNLSFDNELVILHGDNTKGKSTILESIYLLTNGTTPWGEFDDEFHDLQIEEDKYFRIEMEFDGKKYAYFRDNEKRQLSIDSNNKTPRKYFENISSIMFSPEQIDLLMISSSKRREFIDSVVSKIDMEYLDILSKFTKILRQRNAYLKRLNKRFLDSGIINDTDPQLQYWSNEFAKYSTLIMSKRSEVLKKLKTEDIDLIYKPSVTLNMFEDLANIEDITRIVIERLKESIKRDVATGHTNLGAHRDDWSIFSGKEIKRFGSRGEKRVAIGRLIYSSLELISDCNENRPILLLDDIVSELDVSNTKKTLSNETIYKQQTFITVIDINSVPKEIAKKAQIIDLNSL